MQNKIMNHLKCNYLAKKQTQTLCILKNPEAPRLALNLCHFICQKPKTTKSVSLILHYISIDRGVLEPVISKNQNSIVENRISMSEIMGLASEVDVQKIFLRVTPKSSKSVHIIWGLDHLLNCFEISFQRRVIISIFETLRSAKYLFLFANGGDVMCQKTRNLLQQRSLLVLDSSRSRLVENQTKVDVYLSESYGGWKKEIQRVDIRSVGDMGFTKYVPENTVLREKNPDDFVETTFKIGMNEGEKRQRRKVRMPYEKIRIEEEEEDEKEEEEEEEIQLVDEEDQEYDF